MDNLFEKLSKPSIEIKEIPLNGCPSRYFEFIFKGWRGKVISFEDNEFIEAVNFCGMTLKSFYENYKDKFAFSEPQLSMQIDGTAMVKIGVMELELYQKIYDKHENQKT